MGTALRDKFNLHQDTAYSASDNTLLNKTNGFFPAIYTYMEVFHDIDVLMEEPIAQDNQKLKKKRKKSQLTICLTSCKYDAVFNAAVRFGFKEVLDNEDWNLYWSDSCIPFAKMMEMDRYQKVNHFPGMLEICRKDLLARNLNRALKQFPKDYNFFPKTFYLPADYLEFQTFSKQKQKAVFILKPENNCQGKGIRLVKNYKAVCPEEHVLCQQYISKPFLIDGLKFDFRIYILVTSCDPLRIYVYREGLARFATVPYLCPSKCNMSNVYMHLTNYSINKKSKDFNRNEQLGNKRKMSTVIKALKENNQDVDRMWYEIDDIIIKTIISIHAVLKRNHSSLFFKHEISSACFEVLGFDILLDKDLKPYLLEVNHSPSFATDSLLDKEIKESLLYDTLKMINFNELGRKKCVEQQKRNIAQRLVVPKTSLKVDPMRKLKYKEILEKKRTEYSIEQEKFELNNIGNFRLIYPCSRMEYYKKFDNSQPLVYQETKSSKNRAESARLLRESLMQKNDHSSMKSPRGESPKRERNSSRCTMISNPLMPVNIVEEEENRRLNELLRRHAQLRMYGIINAVQNFFAYMEQVTSQSLNMVVNITEIPQRNEAV